MTRSGSPEGSPPDLREAAEDLWEQIGGELCICQHPDVPHWCERCQGRIDVIMAWMRSAHTGDAPPPELWTLLHWDKPDVQPPEQYSDEAKQGWRQAMAQGRTILSFHERGIAGANVGASPGSDPSALRARLLAKADELLQGAAIGAVSADNENYVCRVTIRQAREAAQLLREAAALVPPAEASAGDSLRGWQPIETLDDPDREVLLWTPKERLYGAKTIAAKPELCPDFMNINTRRNWTWATLWKPKPDPPAPREGLVPRVEAPPPSGEEDHRP